jgi:hypothetical protein
MKPTNIKIYTTIDCVKMTPFEKVVLAVIKGVLYEFKHDQPEPYSDELSMYHITIKPTTENPRDSLTSFKITNEHQTPSGLFDEVKRLIEPLCFGFKVQGGFNKDWSTSIIIQRFEIDRQTISYYTPKGINHEN